MQSFKERLEVERKSIEDEFNALAQRRTALTTTLNNMTTDMVRLQGQFQQVNKLLAEMDSKEAVPPV